jgi:prophage maintenance system killer protein
MCKNKMMKPDFGEIVLYDVEEGKAALDVRLQNETVWLTQAQMVELFQRDQSVISRHVNNVFKEGELPRKSNMQKTHIANSDKPVALYNLDVIISVGYRVKSHRGIRFRIWATSVLKKYLVDGYLLNQRRIAERGTGELQQVIALLARTLESHNLVKEEGVAILSLVSRYANAWRLLLQYDEDNLKPAYSLKNTRSGMEIGDARRAVAVLKKDLIERQEATSIFGQERGGSLSGVLGAVQQSFDGEDLYPSTEEKAAHLLYFVIKDHPFTDGNKRIGSFLFLLFLERNDLLTAKRIDNKALVALALLIAASDPGQKELMVKLIYNLLMEGEALPTG